MRVVLDTNVFVSGVFFGGVPGRILEAWRDGPVALLVSPPILGEYHRVGRLLAARHEGVDLEPVLALVAARADVVDAPDLPERVCPDPDDDKFLACALAGAAPVVVSGDKGLRGVSSWRGIEVLGLGLLTVTTAFLATQADKLAAGVEAVWDVGTHLVGGCVRSCLEQGPREASHRLGALG